MTSRLSLPPANTALPASSDTGSTADASTQIQEPGARRDHPLRQGLAPRGEAVAKRADTANLSQKARAKLPDTPAHRADAHLHAMWYQPDLRVPSSAGTEKFHTNLVLAYLELFQAAQTLPPNVAAHLWTDRASTHALFKPIKGPQGTVIDVPHSQVMRGSVNVHTRDALQALIAEEPDADKRRALRTLHASPLGAAIGMRADLQRALYGYLHGREDATADTLNLHIDVDQLAGIHDFRQAKQVLNAPELDYLMDYMDIPELDRHKIKLVALAQDVARLQTPTATPPQAPVEIPASVKEAGLFLDSVENDYFGMIAGNSKAFSIVENTDVLLRRTAGTVEDDFAHLSVDERFVQQVSRVESRATTHLQRLALIDGNPSSGALSPAIGTDYFRLACRIVAARPLLEQRMGDLQALAERSGAGATDDAHVEIQSIRAILATCGEAVSLTINSRSYPPQLHSGPKDADRELRKRDFDRMTFGILHELPQQVKTESWIAHAGPAPSDEQIANTLPALRHAMHKLKAMLAASEAETAEGEPQRLAPRQPPI